MQKHGATGNSNLYDTASMITQSTLSFLRGLKSTNTRAWFEEHRSEYQEAYGEVIGLTAELLREVCAFDSEVAASGLDPKNCIMRIYRDVRFSKDKSPYKTNFFVFINRGGRRSPFGGYYVHIGPEGESFAGGGVYMPESEALGCLRAEISGHFTEWRSILSAEAFRSEFSEGMLPSGLLKRQPKGYESSDPALEYLKYKGYYTQRFFGDAEVTTPEFAGKLAALFRSVQPMVDFLNRSLG